MSEKECRWLGESERGRCGRCGSRRVLSVEREKISEGDISFTSIHFVVSTSIHFGNLASHQSDDLKFHDYLEHK